MDDITAEVKQALRRAYSLGQTYWQQADSESWKQNRKVLQLKTRLKHWLQIPQTPFPPYARG